MVLESSGDVGRDVVEDRLHSLCRLVFTNKHVPNAAAHGPGFGHLVVLKELLEFPVGGGGQVIRNEELLGASRLLLLRRSRHAVPLVFKDSHAMSRIGEFDDDRGGGGLLEPGENFPALNTSATAVPTCGREEISPLFFAALKMGCRILS